MNSLAILNFGEIRVTEDEQFSVFDTIRVIGGKKNPRDAWKALCEQYSEVVGKTDSYKFPGKGQQETPVANLENIFYIIGLLPGAVGHSYRETAAKEMCRKYGKAYEEVVTTIQQPLSTPSPKDIADAIAAVFSVVDDMDNKLVAGLIANEIGKAHPQLKPYMESAKSLLPSESEDEAMSVTVLARMYVKQTGLALSKNNTDHGNAVEMNKLLIEKGLQLKNPNLKSKKDGQPQYLPTESGKPYSKMVFQQGQDSNKTVQQLRWYPTVLKVLV
ncbi:hypothetical protein F7734_53425 [Scytonema sp. UIC 10036]|uniref:hypothetical protein n=1 Tax=Scytonema sp. UIC 10036 TaxID=2304196 RepID=UPI0012DA163A|nr:hypothetical protein [Scytonema sp. UIC 10036]MUH00611.1 hypothetical protein [Scytonema sp. UIC 10036]